MTNKQKAALYRSNAATVLCTFSPATLALPLSKIVDPILVKGLHCGKAAMTVADFLHRVCNLQGNIHKAYIDVCDILFNTEITPIINNYAIYKEQVTETPIFGGKNAPLFERILDVMNGTISFMKSAGTDAQVKQALVLDHFVNTTNDYGLTSKQFGYTRQNTELIVKKFFNCILKGCAWDKLGALYKIDKLLVRDIHQAIPQFTNRNLTDVANYIGAVNDTQRDCILRMMSLEAATIEGQQLVIIKGKQQPYIKVIGDLRRRLSKSVEPIDIADLTKSDSTNEATLLQSALYHMHGVTISNGRAVMNGEGLEEAVRQARIIYEANDWISKDKIAERYLDIYCEPMGAFSTNRLHELGCSNHNKLGYWKYTKDEMEKIKDLILSVMIKGNSVATFSTILKAVRAEGFIHPEETIRTYITDLACPENKNHDLFCLKGYTHLYPQFSWRSYSKQPA